MFCNVPLLVFLERLACHFTRSHAALSLTRIVPTASSPNLALQYDPICHRGYRQPQIEDVVDEDEKHTPLEAANFVMSNPILKVGDTNGKSMVFECLPLIHLTSDNGTCSKRDRADARADSRRSCCGGEEGRQFSHPVEQVRCYMFAMKTKFAGNFRFRIYATLKREVEKVDVAQTDEADQVTALLIDAV